MSYKAVITRWVLEVVQALHIVCSLFFLQRLIEARRMMDKLRACIVANYYASAGLLKPGEVKTTWGAKRLWAVFAKTDVWSAGYATDVGF